MIEAIIVIFLSMYFQPSMVRQVDNAILVNVVI